MMLFSEIQEIPFSELSLAEKARRYWDLLMWVAVCDVYESHIARAKEEIAATLEMSTKGKAKAMRRIWMRTHHRLSGRALSDDPYRFEWERHRSVLAVAQELRAAALEQEMKLLVDAETKYRTRLENNLNRKGN